MEGEVMTLMRVLWCCAVLSSELSGHGSQSPIDGSSGGATTRRLTSTQQTKTAHLRDLAHLPSSSSSPHHHHAAPHSHSEDPLRHPPTTIRTHALRALMESGTGTARATTSLHHLLFSTPAIDRSAVPTHSVTPRRTSTHWPVLDLALQPPSPVNRRRGHSPSPPSITCPPSLYLLHPPPPSPTLSSSPPPSTLLTSSTFPLVSLPGSSCCPVSPARTPGREKE